ncbi:MAG: hypothetical protein AAGD86_11735 [Pseudomonadota bacterium]
MRTTRVMKISSALAIAGIAAILLIIGFPLLQSKASQWEQKRHGEAARSERASDSGTDTVALGLSRELKRDRSDAPAPAARPVVPSSGWRNVWLLPLAALPLLAGLVFGFVASAFRAGEARGDRRSAPPAPGPRDLVTRLADAEHALADREATIAELKAQLETDGAAVADGTAPATNVDALEAQIAARDEIIKGLEETLNENHERWMNLEVVESDRQERVLKLEAELRTASAIIHSLEDDVAEWKARADSSLAEDDSAVEIQSAAGS